MSKYEIKPLPWDINAETGEARASTLMGEFSFETWECEEGEWFLCDENGVDQGPYKSASEAMRAGDRRWAKRLKTVLREVK